MRVWDRVPGLGRPGVSSLTSAELSSLVPTMLLITSDTPDITLPTRFSLVVGECSPTNPILEGATDICGRPLCSRVWDSRRAVWASLRFFSTASFLTCSSTIACCSLICAGVSCDTNSCTWIIFIKKLSILQVDEPAAVLQALLGISFLLLYYHLLQ